MGHGIGSRHSPSVARLAEDRALQHEPADIEAEIVKRLKRNEDRHLRGDFAGVHAAPASSGNVGDEPEARLAILGPTYPHSAKGEGSKAIEAAKNIPATRGSGQRNYRNALVFLAADHQRLPELEQAVRLWIAWSSGARSRDRRADTTYLPGHGCQLGYVGGDPGFSGNLFPGGLVPHGAGVARHADGMTADHQSHVVNVEWA
jgi:hypothetical protein